MKAQVFFADEDVEQDSIQQMVLLRSGVILDDNVLQLGKFAVNLLVLEGMLAGKEQDIAVFTSVIYTDRFALGILPHQGACLLEDSPLDGLSPRKLARLCSYIPQRSGIAIDISALDVVLMGFNPHLGLLEHPDASMRQSAIRALGLVGLSGREEDNYLTLSEGQKQLCILARTLVSGGKLLLLDEPESSLDFRHRYRMLEILKRWVSEDSRSALVALHDPALALECCDQLLLLDQQQIIGLLRPATDSLPEMEMTLSRIYGKISLIKCPDHTRREHLVMLKEQEDFV